MKHSKHSFVFFYLFNTALSKYKIKNQFSKYGRTEGKNPTHDK